MKAVSRRQAVTLATLTAIVMVVAGVVITTSAGHVPSSQTDAQSHGTPPAPQERLTQRGLLEQAWATNGSTGFFVDDGGAPATALSLYDTAWWQQAITDDPQRRARLDGETVAAWLLPILYGDFHGGDADTAGMPPLAILDNAVTLANLLQIPLDGQRVATQLEDLRDGTLYRSDAKTTADWGSTAIAIKILRSVGHQPPSEVLSNLEAKVPDALASRHPANLFTFSIPVLTTMSPARMRAAGAALTNQLAWVESQLPAMIPLERLTASAALRPLVMQTTGKGWSTQAVCRGLLTTADGVKINERGTVDAQATATASKLGCVRKVTPPPWTIAGWPSTPTTASALQASVAGARIALATGTLASYTPLLLASTSRYWAPGMTTTSANLPGLSMLAKLLRSPWPVPTTMGPVTEAVKAPATMQTFPTLLTGWLSGVKLATGTSAAAQQQTETSIFLAAASELKFRLTGDAKHHADSLSVLKRLTVAGLYASTSRDGVVATPSVVATAIAAWILGEGVPVAALTAAGLCGLELTCSATIRQDLGVPLDSPLRATAAVLAVTHPDPAGFPLAL